MSKTHLQVFALAFALSAVGSVSGVAHVSGDASDATLQELDGYRQWTRATKAPMPVANPSSFG